MTEDAVPDPPTDRVFVALASILAAIESGVIEEGEVDWNTTSADENVTALTITVRRHVQPRFGTIQPDE